jgi:integrase
LRWKRIDFIRETLVVAETCYLGRFGTPKTRASKREVLLSSNVVEALKTHFSISANRNPEALVFGTRNGGPLASNNSRNRGFRSACKRAGLPKLSWHSLRQTHGTVQGTPLGCPSPTWAFRLCTTLEVYTHATVIAQREAVNLLENQLFPSVPKKAVESGRKEEALSPITIIDFSGLSGAPREIRTPDLLLRR